MNYYLLYYAISSIVTYIIYSLFVCDCGLVSKCENLFSKIIVSLLVGWILFPYMVIRVFISLFFFRE